jgi:oligopeptidase A
MTDLRPMENPLVVQKADDLPDFDRIRPDHAEPAVDLVLSENRSRLRSVLDDVSRPDEPVTWERLIDPLDDMSERLARAWGPVSHLFAVTSTAEWRAAYNACLPKVTGYHLELSQNEVLYRAYERLSKAESGPELSGVRRKVVHDALRDFTLSGVALPEDRRKRFRDVALRLSQLQSKFQENVLDSAQAWNKHITDESALCGMTAQGKALARSRAAAKGLEGFRLTLDFPTYDAVVSYADDRDLRRELYEAYCTRASDAGPLAGQFDNSALMEEILALRHEQALILGFSNYAAMSLATKMADSPEEVERFLLDLGRRARGRAQAELDELAAFAQQRGGPSDFQPWDVPYYTEKLKEQKLGFSDEAIRPYFQAPTVLRGMFELVQRLYGIRIEPIGGIATWHPDVTTYAVLDDNGRRIGAFYLDPYARDDKRGGAWMDECVGRRRLPTAVQAPVAYLTCNFAPPLAGEPALLTHEEVVTLFHEFGHGLHHLLTRVDEPAVSGIRGVEWDAVELPSQFMENWCYDRVALSGFARHWQTGEKLPESLLEKLRASRTFHAALATMRQLEFGLFDLRVHRDYDPAAGGRILQVLGQVRSEISVLQPPAWNRMPNSFSHVFAGGYAAGYYSYKWAEVLSADAFAAFEESGFSPDTGLRFRDTILAQGGSREMMDLFVEFRGRRPSLEPLLRLSGLA